MNRLQLIIYLFVLNVRYIKSDMQVTFLETFVVFNPEYLENHTVRISHDRLSLNIILNVREDYKDDAWVKLNVEYFVPRTQQFRNVVAYDLNICSVLGKSSLRSVNLFQIFLNNFFKHGNLPKSCPIKKGAYSWRRFRLNKGTIPPFMTLGKYRVELITYFRLEDEQLQIANVTTIGVIGSVKH